jgi:prepilin-type N-terminal cleavage/methylation domain-containing protein
MNFLKSQKNIAKNQQGFTLVEMLVSIALFSIVIVVCMGSILTIVDVNRKSQSLSIVMNDLNFVLESMTRSIKTGEITDFSNDDITIIDQNGREIIYRFNNGKIERSIGTPAEYISLTSNQIEITQAGFYVFDNNINPSTDNLQPRVLISLTGEVNITERVNSAFKIQTTVSQRNLDDNDLY